LCVFAGFLSLILLNGWKFGYILGGLCCSVIFLIVAHLQHRLMFEPKIVQRDKGVSFNLTKVKIFKFFGYKQKMKSKEFE